VECDNTRTPWNIKRHHKKKSQVDKKMGYGGQEVTLANMLALIDCTFPVANQLQRIFWVTHTIKRQKYQKYFCGWNANFGLCCECFE